MVIPAVRVVIQNHHRGGRPVLGLRQEVDGVDDERLLIQRIGVARVPVFNGPRLDEADPGQVVRRQRDDYSWQFVFLGANFDAVLLSRCDFARKHIADVRLHAPESRVIFDTVDLHYLREDGEARLTGDPELRRKAEEKEDDFAPFAGEPFGGNKSLHAAIAA